MKKVCNYEEGYLLIYSETDEIHADLICEDHYKKIINEPDEEKRETQAFELDPLFSWFSQTMCHEPWPYVDVKIFGTVHVWRT